MDAMPQAVMAMVQGPMLLEAALPHHGPPPSQQEQDQMAQSGNLFYKSYSMLQNADQTVTAANEQMNAGGKTSSSVASGIAEAEEMIQRAKTDIEKAEDLKRKAHDSFFNNANPLGEPPMAPKEWDNVTGMAQRARGKLTAVSERVRDARHMARRQHISLISVSEEKSAVIKDAYGAKKDNEILDFLNSYA